MAKRGRPKKRKLKFQLKKKTFFSVVAVILSLLAFLIILSFLKQAVILVRLNQWLLNVLGWEIFLFPFFLIVLSLIFSGLKTPLTRGNVLIGTLLIFFSLAGISRAGILGQFIDDKIASSLSKTGAVLLFLAGNISGLVILFDTSIEQIIGFMGIFFRTIRRYLFAPQEKEGSLIARQDEKKKKDIYIEKINLPAEREGKVEKTEGIDSLIEGGEIAGIPGARKGVWRYPPLNLLNRQGAVKADRGDIKKNAARIEDTLGSFGITARVVEVNPGPAVTQYAIEVALGTKLSKITSLANDLALALAAPTGQIRIEAPIPGRSLAGIELPNYSLELVTLHQMLTSSEMKKAKSKLTVGLGLDVSGKAIIADIGKMPHILIAGQTGSGKSVLLNSWIATLLFRTTPEEVKFLLIDPKRVELTQYEGIPHLLSSVIVEPKKVISALKWAAKEMEERYKKFAKAGARNIDAFNETAGFAALPYIIIFIDELADIIFYSPSEIEDCICRLAQMSRATGIHLIIATQRPSVDVLTGLIKANIPCRISCAVSSLVDSRVILDTPGAEKLLGRGDMLYLPPDRAKPNRIQGTYVDEEEIRSLINFLKNSGVQPVYTEEVAQMPIKETDKARVEEGKDDLFGEAVEVISRYGRASASLLQRKLRIGYARAARILDQLEAAGIIGSGKGAKPREILTGEENQQE